jgi:nucleoside-diphosphate-sugar epimerase
MKILVCGSEGSLMQAVIPKLTKNHAVYGVDSLFRYGSRLGRADGYEFIKADLTDRPSVFNLVNQIKPDLIIQSAARIYSVGGFNKYCADILGEDIQLHNNVLRAAVDAGVSKVVYISSSMVYETGTGIMKEEDIDTVATPLTEYGLSKFFCEKLSIAFEKQYGIEYTLWRPFNILTPYERKETGHGMSHVFTDFIDEIVIKRTNVLPILGDGQQIRCFTWIDEVAGVIADYSTNDKTNGEAFNVANLEPITMIDLAKKIRRIAQEEFRIPFTEDLTFEHKPAYNNDVRYRVPDVTKIKNVLGWEAKMKVDDALRLCIKDAIEINNVKI